MALLFADSFDHYATADLAKKGWITIGTNTIGPTGRRGTNGLTYPAGTGGYARKAFITSSDTVIVGFSLLVTASNVVAFGFYGDNFGTAHVTFFVFADGAIGVYRGIPNATLLGVAPSGSLPVGATNYIELKVKLSDTVGTVEIRVNGSSAPVLSLSGIDTKNGGTADVLGGWNFGGFSGPNNSAVADDFYILDATGTTNNNFLGDIRVDAIFPTSDGTYSQFTPSTPGPHWSLVDETTPNTTDYVDGTALNQIDSYGMQDVSTLASSTVYGVQVNLAALKDDAGPRSLSGMVRTSGTDAVATASALATTQTYVSQVFETDAGGSAWTQTSVNAMEAGAKVTV